MASSSSISSSEPSEKSGHCVASMNVNTTRNDDPPSIRQDSPTGVSEELVLASPTCTNNNNKRQPSRGGTNDDEDDDDKHSKEDRLVVSSIVPTQNSQTSSPQEEEQQEQNGHVLLVQIQHWFVEIDHQFHHMIAYSKNSLAVMDRKTITTALLAVVTLLVLMAAATCCMVALVVLVCSPFWLPIVLFTSPLWFPVLLLTCPIWLTLTVLMGGTLVIATTLLSLVVLWLVWPQEWLPTQRHATICGWLLRTRDGATRQLVKLQAKVVLYAAGVGPAADAALVVLERIDLEAVQKFVRELDWAEWKEQVQTMNVQELQTALTKALWSILSGSTKYE